MTRLIVVALDVTVSRESWETTYHIDPVEHLPEYVAERAANAERLRELHGTDDGVPYRVLGAEERTHPGVAARGFVTVRVAIALTVDAQAWEAEYGLAAVDGVPAHAAAYVATQSPMLEEVTGTVQVAPYASGWLIREDTMRPGRPQ